jgi:carbamoyl-phosphate synthase large subunit
MNILLTSVGRRSYLVQYFKEALGPHGAVICTNSRDSAPARQNADAFHEVPESVDDAYLPEILRICRAHDIRALFSFHDLDTYVLSQHREEVARLGVTAFLPDPVWNEVALDKLLTYRTLSQAGLPCPWTTDAIDEAGQRMEEAEAAGQAYPIIIKARFGFGSLGLRQCRNRHELRPAYQEALAEVERAPFFRTLERLKPGQTQLVMQERISGREICIDVVNDLHGRHLTTLATEVHSMRAGESDTASTLPVDASLAALARSLSARTRHVGTWGIDCLLREGRPHVLDLNPRFTGAYPFSHLAGANLPRALLALVAGEQPRPEDLRCRAPVAGYKDLVPRLAAPLGSGAPLAGAAAA